MCESMGEKVMTEYEWEVLEIVDGELSDTVWHYDIKDIDDVVFDIRNGQYVHVLKQYWDTNLNSGDRKYYDVFSKDDWGRVDQTDELPKYIQKYINKVKEKLN